MRLLPLTSVLAAAAICSACIVVPRTQANYDPDCQIMTHRMVLGTVQLGRINNCSYAQDCVAIVAGLGVTAASAIVSGSIAVVGNVVYWSEKRVGCAAVSSRPASGNGIGS